MSLKIFIFQVFQTYLEPSLIGFDKVGDIVRYLPAGKIIPRGDFPILNIIVSHLF